MLALLNFGACFHTHSFALCTSRLFNQSEVACHAKKTLVWCSADWSLNPLFQHFKGIILISYIKTLKCFFAKCLVRFQEMLRPPLEYRIFSISYVFL